MSYVINAWWSLAVVLLAVCASAVASPWVRSQAGSAGTAATAPAPVAADPAPTAGGCTLSAPAGMSRMQFAVGDCSGGYGAPAGWGGYSYSYSSAYSDGWQPAGRVVRFPLVAGFRSRLSLRSARGGCW